MAFDEWWKAQNGRLIVGDPDKPKEVVDLLKFEFIEAMFGEPLMYHASIPGIVVNESHPAYKEILDVIDKCKKEPDPNEDHKANSRECEGSKSS